MSNEAKLSVELAEGTITNAIAVAIVEAFSPERQQQIIQDVVRAHLNAKPDLYSKETFLSSAVGDGIRTMATAHVRELLNGWRPDIEAAVADVFGESAPKEDLIEDFKRRMVARLARAVEGEDS